MKNTPNYGSPNCNDWWNDENSGLKKKLYTALPKTFSDDFQEFFKNDNDGILKDNVIKRIINNEEETGNQPANNSIGDFSYSHLATAAGSYLSELTTYPKIYAALQAAPIIQAFKKAMRFVC